ncbi:MAG: capsular biosynthesis protein [Prevotella sp.]|nr:capsular biosynthesis protein [Prevotella sp.]
MWLFNSQVSISESGLLNGFTDYHCHLLPGVDDGVQKTDETLSILHLWEQHHVKEVWLTPHIMEDIPNEPSALKSRFEKLKNLYHGDIVLHLSAENMIDNILAERLANDNLLPLGIQGNHLLVETSYFNPPYDMDETINDVLSKGLYVVLAHPERYNYMEMGDYKRLKGQRILFQLSIPSLVGAYGKNVQKKAEILLDEGYYDLCCTDTHSLRFVNFFLKGKISKKRVATVRQIIESTEI